MVYKACPWCGGIHPFTAGKCERSRYKIGYDGKARKDAGHKIRQKAACDKLVKLFKEDSHNLCAVCLKEGIYNSRRVEVHHIEKISERPDLAYDYDNLICLCSQHHHFAEKGGYTKDFLRKIRPPGVLTKA